ncbi:TPA: hypothetical protein DEP58_03430 [Patescibacteria group bacterium]|nr:MAG: hypothetical protein UU98_C0029G0003 [Parcubacteria group bacterium GW2011_GWD2_42_14]HCC05332.1 hypothetical protein [Patescibacteria group bacterium]
MGIFGKKTVAGISEYELKEHHNKLQGQLDSVFPSTRSSSKLKRAALHTALGMGIDRDDNMSSTQKRGVIQREEFEAAVGGLAEQGIITTKEADKLRQIAEKPLRD